MEIVNGTEITYLYAEGQPFALHKKNVNEGETINYLHLDYQGSIMAITDQNGTLLEERNGVYPERSRRNVWGRPRTANTLAYVLPNPFGNGNVVKRGYTFHEHLEEFNLINMNGRLYDPLLGRMISPDNYIQAPDNTQSYNRYSYCVNNPLKYTDPTGNLTWSDVGAGLAIVGGIALLATGNPYGAVLIAGGGSHFIGTLNGVINSNQSWNDASNRSGLVFSSNYNVSLTTGQSNHEQQQQIKITQIENGIYANQNQTFYEYAENNQEYQYFKNQGDVYACENCQWATNALSASGVAAGALEKSYKMDQSRFLTYGKRVKGVVRSNETLTRVDQMVARSGTKVFKNLGRGLAGASLLVTLYDAYDKGKMQKHHWADISATTVLYGIGLAFPVTGIAIGVGYLATDLYYQYNYNKSLTEYYTD